MSGIYDLFQQARRQSGRPNHAPTVAKIMVEEFLNEILEDSDLLQNLLMHGALPSVEGFMKRGRRRSQEAPRPEQMTFKWPAHVLPIVELIDREALYVPSLDEYIPLQPGISDAHLREAAQHLRGHAADTVRVANLIDNLADALVTA